MVMGSLVRLWLEPRLFCPTIGTTGRRVKLTLLWLSANIGDRVALQDSS